MSSMSSTIKIQMSDEILSLVNGTRISYCLARQCVHNNYSQCQYKNMAITKEGKCDSFFPKVQPAPESEQ